MDHYGVRKYRNIENQKISNCVSIRLPEETITSNFQLDRSNTKVGQHIQIKNLVFLPLTTAGSRILFLEAFTTFSKQSLEA